MSQTTKKRSKWFRVAVEGATASDGRTIERSWIEDIASGYDPKTYGARINVEHIKGFTGEKPFKAMGDVLETKAEDFTFKLNGEDVTRLALYALVDPTDDLVALTGDRQKVYTSIEVAPNFAGTGKAGLVGLAATDNPASLGTEILSFSARADDPAAAMFRQRLNDLKINPSNVFSAAFETEIEFEDVVVDQDGAASGESLFEKFMRTAIEAFTPKAPAAPAAPAAQPAAQPVQNNSAQPDLAALFTGMAESFAADRAASNKAFDARFKTLTDEIAGLRREMSNTPDPQHLSRPPATGGDGAIHTDF